MAHKTVVVTGSFDDMRSHHIRFLEEAAKLGDDVCVLLWSDALVCALQGKAPKFPAHERSYLLESLRYVERVVPVDRYDGPGTLPEIAGVQPAIWAVDEAEPSNPGPQVLAERAAICRTRGIECRVVTAEDVAGFPELGFRRVDPAATVAGAGRKKVIVTGCYDWFHSGHVAFFEQVSALGELYVVVGNDANVRLLKGAGHPLFPQDERRYVAGSIRYVKQALIATGRGWMDAEPEIAQIKPDIYAVNEDGDKPEKWQFCRDHGLEYVVLKRKPKEGLPPRQSTALRGF